MSTAAVLASHVLANLGVSDIHGGHSMCPANCPVHIIPDVVDDLVVECEH